MNWEEQVRAEFPILKTKIKGKPLIYLDSAATTQKPKSVIDALSHFYETEYATVHRAIYHLSAMATYKYNQVREKVAAFIHASYAEEIIFTRGTTDSINLVARSYGDLLEKGDEILISIMEHHSNFVPWQMLCERRGCILKVVPVNERAELDMAAFDKLLTPKVKLVAIAHTANSTGTINPIKEIATKAHAVGAVILVDAAQSVGHAPVDVYGWNVDFLAFSGHKMYGPTGIGVLYGKKEHLEKMAPVQGGGDMIEKVTLEKTTYQKPPLRFEAGTPMIAEVIGLGAAIEYLQKLGLSHIEAWERKLLFYATEKLKKVEGITLLGKALHKSGIIGFLIEGVHSLDLGTMLDMEGIAIRTGHMCAQPLMAHFGCTTSARISFAPFNTLAEIDAFIEVLIRGIKILRT